MRVLLYLLLLFTLLLYGCDGANHPALESNVFYTLFPALFQGSAPLGVTLQVRWIAIQSETRMEVWCVYHPICKGKYLKGSVRRPNNEHTAYNKNVAIAYASRKLIIDQSPWVTTTINNIFSSLGLNPYNESMDLSTPVGVGNYVARVIISARHKDGMNQLGDMGGHKYHRVNFSDYTGYTPVNDHNNIRDPDAWQPLVNVDAKLRPVSQIYLTPQLAHLKTWVVDVDAASIPDQVDTFANHRGKYLQKVDYVIEVQKSLTDYQKIVAEFFDNKIKSFNTIGEFLVHKFGNGTLDFHTVFNFVVNSVIHEATASVWRLKTLYNAVRPVTAVRYVKAGKTIKGWGGPGKGIVSMDGKDWNSYLSTDMFPDYPSGTSCLCAAWTEAAKKLIGTNVIDFTLAIPAGSSVIEPGVVPAQSFNLTYHTLDDVAYDCMMSRVWAGVHFLQAVESSRDLCKPYGIQFYEKTMKAISGR